MPNHAKLPALIVTPHSSGNVPFDILVQMLGADAYRQEARAARLERLFWQGHPYTDAIFHDADAHTLHAPYSRFVVDLNRDSNDTDENGVVKTHDFERHALYPDGFTVTPLERDTRLERHWQPFHFEIERVVAMERVRLLVNGHAMAPHGPPMSPDAGKPRPALTLMAGLNPNGEIAGVCHSSLPPQVARDFIAALETHFADVIAAAPTSKEVALGSPWTGDELSQRYSDPARPNAVPAFGLEVNQALYLRDGRVVEEAVRALNAAFRAFLRDALTLLEA
jgi:N-formylglutamate amidohydrolase